MLLLRTIVRVRNNASGRMFHSAQRSPLGKIHQATPKRKPSPLFHQSTGIVNYKNLTNPNGVISARYFAAMADSDLKKRLDAFQDLFVEARLVLEDCTDAAGTTYFDEEAEAAQEAVDEAVEAFQTLIADIDDNDQKNRVLRGNGLKVEQLKGELQMALNGGHDH